MSPGAAMGAITLGKLIAELEKLHPLAFVMYDHWGLRPTTFRSYRGYYEDLALGVEQGGSPATVAQLLANAKAMLGTTIDGWKGGSYRVDAETGVWAAEWGQTSDIAIVGIEDHSHGGREEEGDEALNVFRHRHPDPGWAYLKTAIIDR